MPRIAKQPHTSGYETEAGPREVDSQALYNRPLSMFAMVAMCQPGGITMSTTPLLLASFAASGRFTQAQAAILGSGELAGMTIGLILTSLIAARVNRRWYAILAVVLAVSGHLLTIFAASPGQLSPTIAARLLAGLGEGGLTGIGVMSLAGLAAPDRGFGLSVMGNLLGGAILFALMPKMESLGGFPVILTVIATYTLLFGLAIPLLPARGIRKPVLPDVGSKQVRAWTSILPGLLGLLGILLFLSSIGMVWPIAPQIGIARGVQQGLVASALAAANIAGAGTALFVGWLGLRFGRLSPMIIGAVGVTAAMLTLLTNLGELGFVLNVILLNIGWIFGMPYYFGALAAMDVSGRLVTVSTAMQAFGLGAGQALAAWLLSIGVGYAGPIYTSGAFVVGAVVTMALAMKAADHRI